MSQPIDFRPAPPVNRVALTCEPEIDTGAGFIKVNGQTLARLNVDGTMTLYSGGPTLEAMGFQVDVNGRIVLT